MRLAAGRAVAVFPEGTSTSGESVLPFKASIFEAAALLGCDVQPVTVYYPGAAGLSAVAPFIGDDELVAHLVRVLGEREVVVNLTFAAPENAHGREREELAQWARREVVSGLEALRRREATEISTMGTAHEYPHRYPFGSGHPGALARDADRRAATLS
jgi:1-acyl-sn-glycerol-3-phosphate acyltransferase